MLEHPAGLDLPMSRSASTLLLRLKPEQPEQPEQPQQPELVLLRASLLLRQPVLAHVSPRLPLAWRP